MNGIALILCAALAIGLGALAVLLWSLSSGQYEDLDGAAERILIEDELDLAERNEYVDHRSRPHRRAAVPPELS